ncbi:phosphatidylglycerophosphate phosphatase PTPMT2-like [Wolffia australiana]
MHIEELEDGDPRVGELGVLKLEGAVLDGRKRAVVGVGARFLFYPTLLYNVVRNKIQSEFRWWDNVDEFLLLGAVPFPKDVLRLKRLGVSGVITMNEPYETLVPKSLYAAHGIENLVLPTRDYLFAPSFQAICKGVDFIHSNASCGKTTYVHCKAGRGRSTTVVLCYLVQHRQMDPISAYAHVRARRPRVLLAPSQWQAVQDFYRRRVQKPSISRRLLSLPLDESSFAVVSAADLDGYSNAGNDVWADMSVMYRVQFAGQAALASLSCFLLRHRHRRHCQRPVPAKESCALAAAQPCLLGGVNIGQPLGASIV